MAIDIQPETSSAGGAVAPLEQKLRNQKDTIAELNLMVETKQSRIQELEENIEALKAVVQDQISDARRVQKLEQENERLTLEVGRLRQSMSEMDESRNRLDAVLKEFDAIKKENEELDTTLRILEKSVEKKLSEARPSFNQSKDELDQIITTLEHSLDKQARELDEALTREHELKQRISEFEIVEPLDGDTRKITQKLKIERDQLANEKAGLQKTVENIKPLLERAHTEIIRRDQEIQKLKTGRYST